MELDDLIELKLELGLGGKIVNHMCGKYGLVLVLDNGENVHPRKVAYKTVRDPEKEQSRLDRFVREVRIWFRARGHPLILSPFFLTQVANRPLVCMPCCDSDLRGFMKGIPGQRLDLGATLILAAQILRGLLFARERKIEAHQDLKPENLLLEDLSTKIDGWPPRCVNSVLRYRVRLADFGMANA